MIYRLRARRPAKKENEKKNPLGEVSNMAQPRVERVSCIPYTGADDVVQVRSDRYRADTRLS
jgi:tRNA/tmRNA/rRNA uracil-C5-methylase (TrmA/RlmC/RlmD family)